LAFDLALGLVSLRARRHGRKEAAGQRSEG
jgi:hypothetical protein